MKSRHPRMQKMAHQSYYSFMGDIQAKSQISLGILVKIGLLLVWRKITSFRSGRWQRTYTMMKMIYHRVRNQKLHNLTLIILLDLNVKRKEVKKEVLIRAVVYQQLLHLSLSNFYTYVCLYLSHWFL